MFVAAEAPVFSWVKAAGGTPARFRTDGVGREPDAEGRVQDVDLVPFYRLHRRTYSTYWDLFTPAEWEEQRAEYSAEAERQRRLEAATVAFFQPGETLFEREFNYLAGDDASPQRIMGRPGRRGGSWFSYDVPAESVHPMTLILTFYSGDRRGTPAEFEILVDGQRVGTQVLRLSEPHRFFDVEFPLPAELVRGKEQVTVRFEAIDTSQIATVFGIRVIRGDAER